jgi:hypothetical protein
MKKQLYYLVVDELLSHIPDNIKKVSYLMDLLEIGREVAYRRIQGKIPFAAEELLLMAVDLGVSIDKILNIKTNTQLPPAPGKVTFKSGDNEIILAATNVSIIIKNI